MTHSRAVAATADSVVVRHADQAGGSYFGCLYARGRFYRLSRGAKGAHGIPRLVAVTPRLAGPYAATDQGRYRKGAITGRRVTVIDLRTGRALHTYTQIGAVAVTDMELKANGSVGWIFRADPGGFSVHKLDRAHQLLYTGPLSPGSLALSGSSLYWLTPDGARVARLD